VEFWGRQPNPEHGPYMQSRSNEKAAVLDTYRPVLKSPKDGQREREKKTFLAEVKIPTQPESDVTGESAQARHVAQGLSCCMPGEVRMAECLPFDSRQLVPAAQRGHGR